MRLAALVSFALLAIADGQTQPHRLMGDELYAAYLKRGPAILQDAFPSGTRWPDFLKDFQSRVLPRWHKEECVPSRAMFLFDISLARPTSYPVDFRQLAQAYLRNRREPPGADPVLDAFEIQWNKTVVALLHGRRQPDLLSAFMNSLVDRIVPAVNRGQSVLVDPWIAIARGFVEENYILSSTQTCSGRGCMIEQRGQAALDAYAAARSHEVNRPEATVRSARILLLWNRPADSLRALEALDEASTDDKTIVYWARMVRARAFDTLGTHDAAVAEYTRALALAPQAQSPRLGLLLVEARQGNRDVAARIADAIRLAPDPVVDPWWAYAQGDYRFYKDRLKALRQLVAK